VLVLAAVLYSWDLSRNGDANAFYAAAVLSGTESWKAFFYGSLDAASFIYFDGGGVTLDLAWVFGNVHDNCEPVGTIAGCFG
jgi:hypothetical protein